MHSGYDKSISHGRLRHALSGNLQALKHGKLLSIKGKLDIFIRTHILHNIYLLIYVFLCPCPTYPAIRACHRCVVYRMLERNAFHLKPNLTRIKIRLDAVGAGSWELGEDGDGGAGPMEICLQLVYDIGMYDSCIAFNQYAQGEREVPIICRQPCRLCAGTFCCSGSRSGYNFYSSLFHTLCLSRFMLIFFASAVFYAFSICCILLRACCANSPA